MWLTLLWNNKGMVAIVALIVVLVGLGTAVKVQSARLDKAKADLEKAEDSRDEAIKQHDQLVNDLARQRAILDEREALRRQQEEQNAKLRQTIKDALSGNRGWADAPIPDGVLRALQAPALPGDSKKPSGPAAGPIVPR